MDTMYLLQIVLYIVTSNCQSDFHKNKGSNNNNDTNNITSIDYKNYQRAPKYNEKEYWDWRYHNTFKDQKPEDEGGTYDWLGDYSSYKSVIKNYMKKYHIILHIGSGNSELTVDMYDEGYKSITNIDYNEFIIKQFEEKWKDRKGMVWQVADFQQRLPYEDQKFDVILDKAGIDCLLFNQAENSFETEVFFL